MLLLMAFKVDCTMLGQTTLIIEVSSHWGVESLRQSPFENSSCQSGLLPILWEKLAASSVTKVIDLWIFGGRVPLIKNHCQLKGWDVWKFLQKSLMDSFKNSKNRGQGCQRHERNWKHRLPTIPRLMTLEL